MPAPTIGAEITVNIDLAGEQSLPAITALANGRFAVVWTQSATSYGIRVLGGAGVSPVPGQSTIAVGGATANIDDRPEIVGLPSNDIAVVFLDTALNSGDVLYRNYNQGNSAGGLGSSPQINLSLMSPHGEDGPEHDPSISINAEGDLAVGFRDADGAIDKIVQVRVPPYASLQVSTLTYGSQPDNITQVEGAVGTSGSLFHTYVGSDGGVRVGGTVVGQGSSPDMAFLAGGEHAVVYSSTDGIRLRIAQGATVIASDVHVGGGGFNFASAPDIIALGDGRAMVFWTETVIFFIIGQGSTSTSWVMGRTMNPDGTPDGSSFVIDSASGATIVTGAPRATLLADGRVAVAYQDGVAGDADVKVRILDPRTEGVEVTGTPFDDDHVGSAFADHFVEQAGNDRVAAGAGDDTVFGGLGNDTFLGEADNDTLNGGAGNDDLTGGGGIDRLDGGAGNDIFRLGADSDVVVDSAGTDTIFSSVSRDLAGHPTIENLILEGGGNIDGLGNALINGIIGNDSSNTLDGRGGLDALHGRLGDDTYVLGADSDTVVDTGGTDTIRSTIDRSLVAYSAIENLALEGSAVTGTGNALANSILGNGVRNVLAGLDANDVIWGEGGNDAIFGQGGADRLKGGAGDDDFVYQAAADSPVGTVDAVIDFDDDGDDRIDLTAVSGGTLTLLANVNDPFTAPGQVRINDGPMTGNAVVIEVNLVGTTGAEMQIVLENTTAAQVGADDFML